MPRYFMHSSPLTFNLMDKNKTFIQESGAKSSNSVAAGRARQSPARRPMSQEGAQGTDTPYPLHQNGAQGTDAPYLPTESPTNRWVIAAAGIVMQVALGAV